MFSLKERLFVLVLVSAVVLGIWAGIARAVAPKVSMTTKVAAQQHTAEFEGTVWFTMRVTNKGNVPLKVTGTINSKEDGVAGFLPMVLETNIEFVTGTQAKGSAVWKFRLPAKTTKAFRFLVRITAKQEYCLSGRASAAYKFGQGASVKLASFKSDCVAVS